jgi:AsmA protein
MLDMPGTIQLSPELISKLTGGRAKPSAPIPVAFRLSGPAWKPSVEALGLEPAVQAIAKQAATGAAAKALGVEGGEAEVRARAEAEKQAAEQRARDEAEKAKKRATDEATKRLKGLLGQ